MHIPSFKLISQSMLKKSPENSDGRTDGRTDRRTDGRTLPRFFKRAYKKWHHITPRRIQMSCVTSSEKHMHFNFFSIAAGQSPPDLDCFFIYLAEWHSGCVSALPCERPGFGPRTRLREIIPANNCTMQRQNNWGNWGSPGVMKL